MDVRRRRSCPVDTPRFDVVAPQQIETTLRLVDLLCKQVISRNVFGYCSFEQHLQVLETTKTKNNLRHSLCDAWIHGRCRWLNDAIHALSKIAAKNDKIVIDALARFTAEACYVQEALGAVKAIEALSDCGEHYAMIILIKLLIDDVLEIWEAAAQAIANIAGRGCEKTIATFRNILIALQDGAVRQICVKEEVVMLTARRSHPLIDRDKIRDCTTLFCMFRSPGTSTEIHDDMGLQQAASRMLASSAQVLHKIVVKSDLATAEVLARHLASATAWQVQTWLMEALVVTALEGSPTVTSAIAGQIETGGWQVRERAISLFANTSKEGDRGATVTLLPCLEDDHWAVRYAAVRALVKIADSDDHDVRSAIQRCNARIAVGDLIQVRDQKSQAWEGRPFLKVTDLDPLAVNSNEWREIKIGSKTFGWDEGSRYLTQGAMVPEALAQLRDQLSSRPCSRRSWR